MGEIKSALEKALERVSDIRAEKSRVTDKNITDEGRKAAFRYIEQDGISLEEIGVMVKKHQTADGNRYTEGIVKVITANLVMPESSDYSNERIGRIGELGMLCAGDRDFAPYLQEIFDQIGSFFDQYKSNKEELKEALKKQIEPQLMEKRAAVAEKLGMEVEINPESDPDFQKALRKAGKELLDQYERVLEEIREEIRSKLLS